MNFCYNKNMSKSRQNTAEEALQYWIRQLKLQDWSITLRFDDFNREDGYLQSADIKVDVSNHSACVILCNEETGRDKANILHELLHLTLWEFDTFTEQHIPDSERGRYFDLLEKTVHQLTSCFIEKDEHVHVAIQEDIKSKQ